MSYLAEPNKKGDPVRPGEQWFFYWKTSAALWEGRILEFSAEEIIFIPLYWGFHAESGSEWDFGRIHPERDLGRLAQILTQHKRKFTWILPLTPAPFLPNGGVPASAARTLSVSPQGVHHAVLDQEGKLNKMFSFFEPKVWEAYSHFIKAFGNFLAMGKVRAPLWGMEFFYYQDNHEYSFIEDCSLAFEQGFSRYLKQNNPDGYDLTETKKESELKKTFTHDVCQLFKVSAETTLAPFWSGVKKVFCIGSSPKETIERSLPSGKSTLEFTKDIFHHLSLNHWISSALMRVDEKKEPFPFILNEHFGSSEINHQYRYEIYGAELSEEFRPFGLVNLFQSQNERHFEDIGLIPFLDHHFKWLYQINNELEFTPEWIDLNQHKIKFFHGRELDRTHFGQILKLFMMGERVLLDTSGLNPELEKRLQIFLLENNLKMQSVNYLTTTHISELGEGRLITFEGDKLSNQENQNKFWSHIFRYFNLSQPELMMDEDVFCLWRIRATSPHELSYLDVRRVNFYNPTSYKKQVTIKTHKHFAFMKMIDPSKASAKSTPEGVVVDLLPSGRIALDFGHYEEV